MTTHTTPTLTSRAVRATARAVFTLALYGFALVGVWYVGTTLALAQFGLTIKKAQQQQALCEQMKCNENDGNNPPRKNEGE